ncbi:molybdate ABC transporter permease subunit [Clostridium oryzae]|uniref:Molybdenum transport system permease n=1 Tax=Clostridium oryzae TaxID=1450648 RepID=A0A1V4IPI3_9CLOT|nr:molybdate ABC transporter permease subunit [Clostridium oryzae]OPJ61918.1 molybdenum transport system permease protein ModB [Clostridium oryzae]
MNFDYSPLCISVKTALCSTVITFFIGICAARLLYNKQSNFAYFMDAIFTLPLVLPPTVLGLILLIIFGRNSALGSILYSFGIQIIFSWPATVIAAVAVSFPIMYKTTKGAFEQIDNNILSAAKTLGVSNNRIFWTITIPLAWPGIAAAAVLSFSRSIGEFGATLMLAGSIPGKTTTIPMAIYFAVEGGDMKTAVYWVIIIMILSFIIIAVSNNWSSHHRKFIISGGEY